MYYIRFFVLNSFIYTMTVSIRSRYRVLKEKYKKKINDTNA